MKKVMAKTFPGGRPDAIVTSVTLVNNTVKTLDNAVPTDEVWKLINIKATNPDDVARVIAFSIYKEAAATNHVCTLSSQSRNAAAQLNWPNTEASALSVPPYNFEIVLGPGWIIRTVWATGGASAGGTDADGLVVWVRRMPLT